MSKAEDRALEAYPSTPNWDERITCMYRGGFIKGYHQAEKDTIEKAAKWLKNNLEGVVGGSIYIEDFLKAMRDE